MKKLSMNFQYRCKRGINMFSKNKKVHLTPEQLAEAVVYHCCTLNQFKNKAFNDKQAPLIKVGKHISLLAACSFRDSDTQNDYDPSDCHQLYLTILADDTNMEYWRFIKVPDTSPDAQTPEKWKCVELEIYHAPNRFSKELYSWGYKILEEREAVLNDEESYLSMSR